MTDYIKKFKQNRNFQSENKVQKAQLGTTLQKGWNWLKNATQVAAIAENPAVMTAAGWTVDSRTGKASQDSFNTPERNRLSDNLATIGEVGIMAPTIVGDLEGVYGILRHPKQTFNLFLSRFRKPKSISNLDAKLSEVINLEIPVNQEIKNGGNLGIKDVFHYYNSPEYIHHLKSTGLTESEARQLQKLKIDNLIDTKIKFDVSDHYGHTSLNLNGDITVFISSNNSNTPELARETMWHELGGHASSRNYQESLQPILNRNIHTRNIYSNPWYRKISQHNRELIPDLKPQWKAFKEGDIETFKKLASKEDLKFAEKVKNPKSFIEYLEDEQETAARAISANIGDSVGQKTQWNLQQLEQFFTSEGIKKLRKNVWSTGIGLGGVLIGNWDYLPELGEK